MNRFCSHEKLNFADTCVILGNNVTEDIMESFRLANEAVLDKLSPPLRLGINKTDIYREGRGFSYDNTSKPGHFLFVLCLYLVSTIILQNTGCVSSSLGPETRSVALLLRRVGTSATSSNPSATPPSPATPSSTPGVRKNITTFGSELRFYFVYVNM